LVVGVLGDFSGGAGVTGSCVGDTGSARGITVYLLMGSPICAMADLRWRPAFHLSPTSVNLGDARKRRCGRFMCSRDASRPGEEMKKATPYIAAAIFIAIAAVSYHSVTEIHYLKTFYPNTFTVENAFFAALVEAIKVSLVIVPLLIGWKLWKDVMATCR